MHAFSFCVALVDEQAMRTVVRLLKSPLQIVSPQIWSKPVAYVVRSSSSVASTFSPGPVWEAQPARLTSAMEAAKTWPESVRNDL